MKNLLLLFSLSLLFQLMAFAQEGWFPQNSGVNENLNAVYFLDENIGFAVGNYGVFLSTTNGGDSWNCRYIGGALDYPADVFFTNENNGFVVGSWSFMEFWYSILEHTTDSGENWTADSSVTDESLSAVNFIDTNTGWVVGYYGGPLVRITTDGGTTWSSQIIDTTDIVLSSVNFVTPYIGWTVGGNDGPEKAGIIYKTNDGGNNWTIQLIDTNNIFTSVDFIDTNTGWVVGGGKIYKTTNGGINWINQPGNFEYLSSVKFINQDIGWAVGGNYETGPSEIYKTADGGSSWITQVSDTSIHKLYSVFFINANTGWVVGSQGAILKTTTGGTVFVDVEKNDNAPKEFILSQNYPNPFNPTTKISWQAPEGSWQTLKVYDILGKEVTTMVNEYKPEGKYQIEFDAKSLPSGVYFYQLKAENFVETKKMILLK